jgi:uncharacterized protein (DUF1330 family)
MAAYVIVEVEVLDKEKYDNYRPLAAKTIAQYGGRYIVRGGASEVLEGDSKPGRLVILEFPSAEVARNWYNSPEYNEGRAMRQASSRSRMVVVDGI